VSATPRSRPAGGGARRRAGRKHRDAWRGAGRRLRERPFAHAFALVLLALALLALLLLKGGIDQFQRLGSPLVGARTLSLFLSPGADQASARVLATELAEDARVATVDLISPGDGLAELTHVVGSQEALAALPDNPLPWVLAVEPRDRAAGAALAQDWAERPEIEYLADEGEWQDRADAVLRAARALFVVLFALVVVAVVLLAGNAVRTIRVEGAQERALQRVFGASEADLRRPYVYLGLLYGLIAGALALLAALAVRVALAPAFAALAGIFSVANGDVAPAWPWLLATVPAAGLLGALGAWLGCLFERDLESRG
jgi:cell division transport system permease protein